MHVYMDARINTSFVSFLYGAADIDIIAKHLSYLQSAASGKTVHWIVIGTFTLFSTKRKKAII